MLKLIAVIATLLCCEALPWELSGTGHPRVGEQIYDHFSASATDVSLQECQAACAGFDQCVGINYNDRYCWVFADGCASTSWEGELKGFEHAGYSDCPTGKPDNFLLDDDETLHWYANPRHQACGTFASVETCPTTHCSWDGSACQTSVTRSVEGDAVGEVAASAVSRRTAGSHGPSCGPSHGPSHGPSLGPLCGDPITRFNGKTIQFWLPLDTKVEMISIDDFSLFGMANTKTSLRTMQWFSDFELRYKGDKVLTIGTQNVLKAGLSKLEAMVPPAKLGAGVPVHFLDVYTYDQNQQPQQASLAGSYFLSQGLVVADLTHDQKPLVYKLNKETLRVKEAADLESTVFEFHAAKANKFTDVQKQLKHLHLDMSFGDIGSRTINGGALPQIWGIQARTPEVEKMLRRPY